MGMLREPAEAALKSAPAVRLPKVVAFQARQSDLFLQPVLRR